MNINHNRLVPGGITYWGDIVGNLTDQKDLVDYISTHGGGGGGGGDAVWGSITGNLSDQTDLMNKLAEYATEQFVTSALSGYATESWVTSQGYLTEVPSEYATQSWVQSQGYLTEHQDLSSYATQSWVQSFYGTRSWVSNQISSALEGYATETWVQSQGYLTEHQDLSSYATKSWTDNRIWYILVGDGGNDPYATEPYVNSAISDVQSWVESKNYVEASNFDGYMSSYVLEFASQSWVESYISDTLEGDGDPVVRNDEMYIFVTETLSDYATESWVASQGYVSTTDLSSYATKSWVTSNFLGSTALTGYATESWVQSQSYLTSESSTITNILSSISSIESILGSAVQITNQILS